MEGTRRAVCSKEQFLSVLVPVLKAHGVVFMENGKKVQSQAKYWDLYRLVKNLDVAIAASAGADVSLAGVGTLRFTEVGRVKEDGTGGRYLAFKQKVSSSVQKTLKENQDLIKHDIPDSEEEFVSRVSNVLDALGTKVTVAAPTVITADSEDSGAIL